MSITVLPPQPLVPVCFLKCTALGRFSNWLSASLRIYYIKEASPYLPLIPESRSHSYRCQIEQKEWATFLIRPIHNYSLIKSGWFHSCVPVSLYDHEITYMVAVT